MFPVLPLVQVRHGEILGGIAGLDPRGEISRLARAAGELVVVDLDGLASNRPDIELLRDASRRNQIWMDAGSREASDALEMLVVGASRVTIRWSLLRRTAELEEIAELAEPGCAYLALEFRDVFVANPRMPALGVSDALDYAAKLELPVVAFDVDASGAGRRAVANFKGERWYAAPLPADSMRELEAEGWKGAIGLPEGARTP